MQEVKLYFNIVEAKNDMEYRIKSGWRVHTCATSHYMTSEKVLVVYEKVST